ncbi:MAG: helix-turn-helix transcriptional regulator [Bacteroidetes bacterium]|nr:MAG: helix-turn-helix transcriptional regulator [Bacteroidota bacterium]
MNTTDTTPLYFERIDITTARSNANKYIQQYNQKAPSKKEWIRGGVLATLMRVIDAFVRQNNFVGQLAGQSVPCRLNNCMLADQLKVDRRTIINHLNKLEKAGFLTKKFRGTYANYELTVSACVLVSNNVLLEQINAPTTTPEPLENTHNAKKVRPISLATNVEISNMLPKPCELGDNPVENSGVPPASAPVNKALATISCHQPKVMCTGEKPQGLSTSQKEKKEGGGGANFSGGAAAKKHYPAWQIALVKTFYSYLITHLYPYRTYSADIERAILNKVFSHVYYGFKEPTYTRTDWEGYHEELLERVRLIKAWLDRPLPQYKAKQYEMGKFLVNPLTFLDRNCPYGFAQTAQWLVMAYQRKELIKAELELDKARKEIITGTDRLNVYRRWEKRFKNKKLPEAQTMFYKAMADIQNQLVAIKQAS